VDPNDIQMFVNPLAFLDIDRNETIKAEHVLNFLCTPDSRRSVEDMVQLYKKVSVENLTLFAAPAQALLLERLIWPLRQAKGSFMLRNFLGTIALCGMVA
jgi:hypothetical protein